MPLPDLGALPVLPPLDLPQWLGRLPQNPYFWILVMGIWLGLALALGLRFGDSPQRKIRLRKQNGFWVPLFLALAILTFVVGLLWTRLKAFDVLFLFYGIGSWAFFSLVVRFPRAAGIPLGVLVILGTAALVLVLGASEPVEPGSGLVRTRLVSDRSGFWTVEMSPRPARLADLPRGKWMPERIFVLETPGFLSLSGARQWVGLEESPDLWLSLSRGLFQGLGLLRVIPLAPPDQPKLFYVYDLRSDPRKGWNWAPLFPPRF